MANDASKSVTVAKRQERDRLALLERLRESPIVETACKQVGISRARVRVTGQAVRSARLQPARHAAKVRRGAKTLQQIPARCTGLRKPQSRARGSRPKDLCEIHTQGGHQRGEARADGVLQIKTQDYERDCDDRAVDRKSSNLFAVDPEEIRTFPNGGSTMRHLSLPILHNPGGGGEIRTHDTFRYAAFPRRCTRPLCDASNADKIYHKLTNSQG